jgi:hypothetical protein
MSIHGYQFEPNQRHPITSQHKARLFRPNMAKHVSHHSPMVVAIIETRDSLDQLRAVNRLGPYE